MAKVPGNPRKVRPPPDPTYVQMAAAQMSAMGKFGTADPNVLPQVAPIGR